MSFKNFLVVALLGLMLAGGFLAYKKDTGICFVVFLVLWFLIELFVNQCYAYMFGRKKFVITRIKKSLKTGEIIEIGNEKHSFTADQIKTEHKKKFFFYPGLGLKLAHETVDVGKKLNDDLAKFAKQAEIYYTDLWLLESLFYDLKTTRITTLRLEMQYTAPHNNEKYLVFKGNNGCSYHQNLFTVEQIHKTTNQRFQVSVTKEQRYEDYVSELDVFMKETGLAYIGESPVINESTNVEESPVVDESASIDEKVRKPVLPYGCVPTDSGYLGIIGVPTINIYDEPK